MNKRWVVLANASVARIFSLDANGKLLSELEYLVHPESRSKASELVADQAGHAQHQHGGKDGHGVALQTHVDPKRHQHQLFARQLAEHLEHAVEHGQCSSWTLLASDAFLGELRAQLKPAAARALERSLAHDYTALGGAELQRRLHDVLAD